MRLDVRKAVGRMASHHVVRHDLPASVVVFLVAVPLSLGIAVASDAPVTAGLIAAAVGGIVAGTLGGSPLQVSGPAAGLTVVVAGLVERFGWRATCMMTVAAGALQMALGLSRVARSVLAISPTVVRAMLAGIGASIALGQLHVLLGGRPGASPVANLIHLPGQVADVHDVAALIGLAVIVVLLVWPRLPAPAGVLPAPLVAVVGVTLVAELSQLDVPRVDLSGAPVAALQLPSWPSGSWTTIVIAIVTLAAVASVESLVSAVAVDKLRPGQRIDFDRELLGQGAANAVSGLLGGLPVTGVIVRSSANVIAGATSRASAILHGVWVLVFSLALAGLIERIPMAVLAGLLVVIGFQLVKPGHLSTARAHGELPVYVATAAGVVVLGLLEGVLVGVAVSVALMVRRVLHTRIRVEPTAHHAHAHWTVVAEGTLSFLSVPRLSRLLAEIPVGSVVVLYLLVDFLDHAVSDHLRAWKRQHEASGGVVVVDELALLPRPAR